MEPPEILKRLAKDVGGKIDEVGSCPDGSGWATMSLPLPKDHWLTQPGHNEPPMPFRVGTEEQRSGKNRQEWADAIRAAGKYAVRASTTNGKIIDFDPDAMLQNFVVGMLGYWTTDGKEGSSGSVQVPREE